VRSRAHGFTLVDLMLAIALIGLLAAMAYPRYTAATSRAKRVEGRMALAVLWRSQQAVHVVDERYAQDFNRLGSVFDGGEKLTPNKIKGRYYTVTLTQPWGKDSFYAVAEGNIDQDPISDILIIYEMPEPKETSP